MHGYRDLGVDSRPLRLAGAATPLAVLPPIASMLKKLLAGQP